MVKQIGPTIGENRKSFQGLSGDDKPAYDVGGMSSFYESDTSDVWIYDELNINPSTLTKWWIVGGV